MFRDVPGCSGMFRNVPECSMFLVLSTTNHYSGNILQSFLHLLKAKNVNNCIETTPNTVSHVNSRK